MGPGNAENVSMEASDVAVLCNDVKDVGRLLSSIIELGKGSFP